MIIHNVQYALFAANAFASTLHENGASLITVDWLTYLGLEISIVAY